MCKIMKLKVIEFFAGIGSQSKALKNIDVDHEVVATADWDIFANISYAGIHHHEELMQKLTDWESKISLLTEEEHLNEREELESSLSDKNLSRDGKNPITSLKSFCSRTLFILKTSLELNNSFTDIKKIKGSDLPNHNMITYSFPCQDLSLQGSQKGLHDGKASSMLWEVGRVLKELKTLNRLPKYLVMENVKSLFSEKYIDGFNSWKKELEDLGYINHEFILNSKFFDVPQNRERAFMVSELSQNKFTIPKPGDLTKKTIGEVLDKEFEEWKPTKGLVEDWQPEKKGSGLAKSIIKGYTSFHSESIVFAKNSISPTITATGALNRIKVIEKKGVLRMLNSREQWQLMGFEKSDWEKVDKLNVVPEMNLRKQAGNSIVVQVLEAIFKEIK